MARRTMLTARFALEDFAVSSSRPELVRPVPADLVGNVRRLAQIAEDAQTWLDQTYGAGAYRIAITSGYRPPELNAAVGGGTRSDHLQANAMDLVVLRSSDGQAEAGVLAPLTTHIRYAMAGRFRYLELSTRHIHVSNGSGDEGIFELQLRETVTYRGAPTTEQVVAVGLLFAALLALRRA